MKKIWGLGALALSCGLGFTQFACSSASDQRAPSIEGDSKIADLIGSVPVNSQSLDGIGSIGLVYEYTEVGGFGGSSGFGGFGGASDAGGFPILGGASNGGASSAGSPASAGFSGAGCSGNCQAPFYPQCTGTLISKSSVLTSRSCAQLFEQTYYGYSSLKFVIGADPMASTRRINVVDVEYAPSISSDSGVSYPDLAVLHLGESITDVASFPTALLTDDLIGQPLAGVGFGNSDLRYQYGTRRAGSLVLRGTSGLLYPLIFNSFEDFYAYVLGAGYPGPYPGAGGANSLPLPVGTSGAASAGASNGGAFPTAGAAGSLPGGAGGAFPGGAGGAFGGASGGGGDDWYRQYLQQQYDTTELAPAEAYLGGTDSDAQPCGADQGGPMVRKLQGKVRVFGVFSRAPFGNCEKGGIYASITDETKAFVDAAAQWKDPCSDLTANGKCVGNTATRCSTAAEGKRRAVKFDCALLNQVCVAPGTTEVTCTDK